MNRSYQTIIIGGGPADLTAGLYCARAGLGDLLIGRGVIDGQIDNAAQVENYPGFPRGISGIGLGQRMYEQATGYGLETLFAEVIGLGQRMYEQATGYGLETLFAEVIGLVPHVARQIRHGKGVRFLFWLFGQYQRG